jgi:hypothetical protein
MLLKITSFLSGHHQLLTDRYLQQIVYSLIFMYVVVTAWVVLSVLTIESCCLQCCYIVIVRSYSCPER